MAFGGIKKLFRFKKRAGKKGVRKVEGAGQNIAAVAQNPTDLGARADAATGMVRPTV